MSSRSANMPFRFVSCMELREVLGKRATDEHRLLELIEEVPADSIYYHTHSYFLRHAYTQQLYSNDFATWVVLYAQDRVLGERLGILDPFEFSIDVSTPQHSILQFLRPFVVRYDAAVFSLPKFSQRLPLPQFLVYPSIDPFSEKNRELEPDEIDEVLQRLGVPRDKPILLQVSRFDRFKDPVGVVAAYRLVKKSHDCRLVLAGGTATDDPEGAEVLAEVQEAVGTDPDVHILLLPPTANLEINALQRAATIIYQKSTREGFGLTVAEALWKGKPVIGGETGGITVQLIPGVTGFTVNSPEGAAF